jgi:hypothetical protein
MKLKLNVFIVVLSAFLISCICIMVIIGIVYMLSKDEYFPTKGRDYDNAIITLDRSACYGTCPDYTVKIWGNGTVSYNGNSYVEVTGTHSYKIPKENVQKIVDKFYEIDYFSLKDSYDADVTDLPTTITSITIDGNSKKIYDYYGAPDKLKGLEDYIDQMANTSNYVGNVNE